MSLPIGFKGGEGETLTKLLKYIGAYKLYEKWLFTQVKSKEMPQHLAVILDGNRRWATQRSLPTFLGHVQGAKKGEEFLEWCLELGIKTVTVYVFSTENFNRPEGEVKALFDVIEEYVEKLRFDPRIHNRRVRVKAIGRIGSLPTSLREKLRQVEDDTKRYSEFFFNIAIAYGGRAEIVDATRKLVGDVLNGKVNLEEIDEEAFTKYLYTSHLPNPYPDLVIRSSGEERLSGFLLWQTAYSELFFLDVYWPDFRKIDLLRAIRTFQRRKRRFGA
jgi:tritrans,polycis-undecaprenyl-diphosphate synthase [geranylgeranyl-diphosphate specific]